MATRSEGENQRTRIEAGNFEQAIAARRASRPRPGVHPRIHEAEIEALERACGLREQLDDYERPGSQG